MTSGPATDPSAVLERLAVLARDLGAGAVARAGDALAERIREGRFYVVALGQFKRGKSTLLNALVGQPILPAGIVPITSAVTVLRYGASAGARIRVGGGGWVEIAPAALSAYVSEEENPGNEKAVTGTEVVVPSPLLASGLCLVDTPGVGSVSVANSEATRAFVPHIDAALVVLGVDPPIAGDEVALIREVAAQTSIILVVLNKADRHSDGDRAEAVRFSERVLGDVLGRPPRVFEVSAVEVLAGRSGRDWEALLNALRELAATCRGALVQHAARRGVTTLCDRLLDEVDHERAALERPLEESEALLARLGRLRARADEVLEDLGHRLAGVEERLRRAFGEERDQFFSDARRDCTREVIAHIGAETPAGIPSREDAYEATRAIAQRRLDTWKTEVEPRAERLYRNAVRRFIDLANGVQQDLAQSGVTGLSPLDVDTRFTVPSRYYPAAMMHLTGAKPGVLGVLLPAARRRDALAADAAHYIERLLEVNSARLTNDFVERVTAGRRALERELRERLHELVASAERAVARARIAKDEGLASVAARLAWLGERRQELEALRQGASQLLT